VTTLGLKGSSDSDVVHQFELMQLIKSMTGLKMPATLYLHYGTDPLEIIIHRQVFLGLNTIVCSVISNAPNNA
jgi:hypothetical protein